MNNTNIAPFPSASITEHYRDIGRQIASFGFIKPAEDFEDSRIQKAWESCLAAGHNLEVIPCWDLSNLATANDPHYEKLQNRIKGEEGVREYYKDFYINGIRQDRIIWAMEIGGVVYIFIGNKRVQAHKMGIDNGKDSRCCVLMVDPGNISDEEKVKIGFELALLGNKKRHTTRGVSEEDYMHQLKQSHAINCAIDPKKSNWSEQETIDWAKTELVRIYPHYELPDMAMRAGIICSQAFSSAVGLVLPFPTTAEIAKTFKKHWPNNQWDESSSDPLMLSMTTHRQSLKSQIEAGWENRLEFTPTRKEAWLALRTGKTKDAKITKQDTIDEDRDETLAELQKYNLNVNHTGAGHPLITRILFVKQTNIDKAVAYEWNSQHKRFDEI